MDEIRDVEELDIPPRHDIDAKRLPGEHEVPKQLLLVVIEIDEYIAWHLGLVHLAKCKCILLGTTDKSDDIDPLVCRGNVREAFLRLGFNVEIRDLHLGEII